MPSLITITTTITTTATITAATTSSPAATTTTTTITITTTTTTTITTTTITTTATTTTTTTTTTTITTTTTSQLFGASTGVVRVFAPCRRSSECSSSMRNHGFKKILWELLQRMTSCITPLAPDTDLLMTTLRITITM